MTLRFSQKMTQSKPTTRNVINLRNLKEKIKIEIFFTIKKIPLKMLYLSNIFILIRHPVHVLIVNLSALSFQIVEMH